ncbi:MAG: CHRD domain-containing protein [Burkholderiales bacterium PBB3]|nr:MAG: CHRD domain-containing protein [Burkholderiales bacterium PBB3]
MTPFRTLTSCTLVVASLLLGACTAPLNPDTTKVAFRGKLSASEEVPPGTSTGTGTLKATFDTQSNLLNWTVTYSGLTGPVVAGHFHGPALLGQNAGVALGFSGSLDSPIKGSATLTPAQAADFMAGKWYVNLHTAANKGGEIRAQALLEP